MLWIVQVSRELLSSQWKPPSTVVKTHTLKSSYFGKRPYTWNQIRTTFLGPSVSNILRVGSQGPPCHDILPVLHNPSNEWASNLCFTETFEDMHFMINSSAHEFLTIQWGAPFNYWKAIQWSNIEMKVYLMFESTQPNWCSWIRQLVLLDQTTGAPGSDKRAIKGLLPACCVGRISEGLAVAVPLMFQTRTINCHFFCLLPEAVPCRRTAFKSGKGTKQA